MTMADYVDIEVVAMALAVMAVWMFLCHARAASERDEARAEVHRLRKRIWGDWNNGEESDA